MGPAGAQDAAKRGAGKQSKAQHLSSQDARRLTETRKRKGPKYDVERIGHRGIGEGVNEYSVEEERQLGRELSQQVERMMKMVTDPVITEYVDWLGQTIVRNSDARVPFTIKVIDSDEVNTFALPGGISMYILD